MTVKVGPKGQVVIPKAIRDRLGIRAGDPMVVEQLAGDHAVRIAKALTIEDLAGSLPDSEIDPLEVLARERRREQERERRAERGRERAR